MSRPKIVNLDSVELSEVAELARVYADEWISRVKLSSHKSVTPLVSATWLRYNRPIDYVQFTVNENPFTIYADGQTDLQQLKPMDFSFPEKCVSENVISFFSILTSELNLKFDFDKRMTGETSFMSNKATKEMQKFHEFRPFFNFPDSSKSKSATNVGHVRIDIKRPDSDKYEVSFVDTVKGEPFEPKSIQDLISFLEKFGTFRVTIKPSRIISAPVYFGSNYKLMWQTFIVEKLVNSSGDICMLQSLCLSSSSPVKRRDSWSDEGMKKARYIDDSREASPEKNQNE